MKDHAAYAQFSELTGKTILAVNGAKPGSDTITIICTDNSAFIFEHQQDCCESVRVEDVAGDVSDLIGQKVMLAEVVTNSDDPHDHQYVESFTWTFYKLRTHKGDVTLRWFGESNGYYSEHVDITRAVAEEFDLTEEQKVLQDKLLEQGL